MNISKLFSTILAFVFLILFVACGPVKFSSSSNKPSDTPADQQQAPPDPNPNPNPNPTPTTETRDVTTTHVVESKQDKVDILLIVDNSSSMNADNIKLAERLNTFVTQLESAAIDWQMCLVVTSYMTVSSFNYWGLSISWGIQDSSLSSSPYYYNPPENWILKRQSGVNLPNIFRHTLENNVATGSAYTNDERGIKAAFWHTEYKDYNHCYRSGAALAHIYISDEDVRSIGGVAADRYYATELLNLEADDMPSNLIDQIKARLGADKRFRANSIIVKPTDSACLGTQDAQGTKAHYGRQYDALSKMSGGGIGSICDTDYNNNLNFFNEVINDSLESMPLECNPISNNVSVTITPNQTVSTSIQGQSLVFNPSVKAGSTVVANYKCSTISNNRVPNSVDEDTPSLWSRVVNWFKSLF